MFGQSIARPGRFLARCALAAICLSAALNADTGDSAPVLLSTTGGKGAGWATTAELKKAAEAHNPKACAQYGDALLRGDEVKQDTAQALMFLREAVSLGEPNAAFRLGKVYDDGELAPQDYAKAFEYYGIAAKAGVAEAQYNLGVLYASARGTKRDYVEGLAWLIVATKNGATGDGEQKTREQLNKIKRPQFIAAAEQRATEILKDPATAAAGVVTAKPVTPPKVAAPAKVDIGGPSKPTKVKIAPTAPLPPLAPGLGSPLAPPPRLEPQAVPPANAGGQTPATK